MTAIEQLTRQIQQLQAISWERGYNPVLVKVISELNHSLVLLKREVSNNG
jgi:hypothetical protein